MRTEDLVSRPNQTGGHGPLYFQIIALPKYCHGGRTRTGNDRLANLVNIYAPVILADPEVF